MRLLKNRKNFLLALIICFLLNICFSAKADISPGVDGWHFLFAPYGWLTSLTGNVTVRNNTQHIFITFKDILDNLDYAAEAHIEGGYGPVTLMIDPTYLKLTKDIQFPLLRGSVTTDTSFMSKTLLVDAGAFLRIYATPAKDASVELLGGARYLGVENSMNFPRLPPRFSVSDDTTFTVPIAGVRLKYDPNPRTLLWLRGDVGGFNVDNVSLTWSGTAGVAYAVSTHVDIGAAWRMLGINFAKGNSAVNIVFSGPMIGVAFYS